MSAVSDVLLQTETPIREIVLRLFLALLFSAGIGYEREVSAKPAGLCTHMLVGLAASAFTLLAIELAAAVAHAAADGVRADPTRVIEAVVTGVAFLGGGAIIRARGSVSGITTGASIWLAGAIGLGCGAGHYAIAVLTSLFGVLTLWSIKALERRFIAGSGEAQRRS